MNRIKEIEARLEEIREMLDNEEKRGNLTFKELEEEVRELKEEKEELETRERLKNETKAINEGEVRTKTVETFQTATDDTKTDFRSMSWDQVIETNEYRDAWAKDMLGQKLSEEEREVYDQANVQYREFTHNTENTSVLIPKTVVAGIWKRAEEQYPLWADVRKLRVQGNLTMIKGGNSALAQWYDEADVVDTDELGFGTLELTGCELAKAVQVTWKLRKMAINEFVAYIQREIGDRMGIALSHATYEGKGKPGGGDSFKPEPYGIKTRLEGEADTPQVLNYTELAYQNLTAAMGGLHSSYANGAVIYANNATIWGTLANLVDGNGRPMFIADVMTGGVGRIFGRVVKADASIPEGEILVGDANAGYLANINEDITMYREDHVRERLTDYMGYAIVDGDVVDTKAFVILKADTTPEV